MNIKMFLNNLLKNKYFYIITVALLIYTIAFFVSPYNTNIGDFYYDYRCIYDSMTSKGFFIGLFDYETYYGSFLYNLLTLLNLYIFGYNIFCIKIFSCIINICLIIISYFVIRRILGKNLQPWILVFFLALSIDFFGVFRTASLNSVKSCIVLNLLSFLIYDWALKSNRIIISYFALSIQLFAFFLPSFIVYSVLFFNHKGNRKSLLISLGIFITILIINISCFFNMNFDRLNDKFIYTFSSILVPSISNQQTSFIFWLYFVSAIVSIFYIILTTFNAIKNKDNLELLVLSFLGFNLLLTFLNYSTKAYNYAIYYLINHMIFSFSIILSFRHIKPGKYIEYKNSLMHFNLEKICIGSAFTIILITTLFALCFQKINKNYYLEAKDKMDYACYYDGGLFLDNGELSYVFETNNRDIVEKYSFLIENEIIDRSPNFKELEKNESMNHKETIRVLRGMQYDGIGNPWIRSNFAFEVYVESAFLLMDIYVPFNGKNNITMYINNQKLDNKEIFFGGNSLAFNSSNFIGENVIVNVFFDKEHFGPFDGDGEWAATLVDLSFNDKYGYYDIEEDGKCWTNLAFGNYFRNVRNSYKYGLFLPFVQVDNSITIYINGNEIFNYEIKAKDEAFYIELDIDLKSYYNQSVAVEFKIGNPYKTDNDKRTLGVTLIKLEKINVSELYANKNLNYNLYKGVG